MVFLWGPLVEHQLGRNQLLLFLCEGRHCFPCSLSLGEHCLWDLLRGSIGDLGGQPWNLELSWQWCQLDGGQLGQLLILVLLLSNMQGTDGLDL